MVMKPMATAILLFILHLPGIISTVGCERVYFLILDAFSSTIFHDLIPKLELPNDTRNTFFGYLVKIEHN